MNVIVRQRDLKNKRKSLYLDIYVNGVQTQETLGLYLESEKGNPLVKQKNKETLRLAETIKLERLSQVQHQGYGKKLPIKSNKTFNLYFQELVDERKKTGINYDTWYSVGKHLDDFKNPILFADLTEEFLENFKSFLTSTKKLSPNSANTYFNKLKAAVHKAYRAKYIYENPADRVKSPKPVDTHREYLTENELNLLVKTPCRIPLLKTAFIFSCLTGLRWSDIHNISWSNIQTLENIWHIVYTQKKTKNAEKLPISETAFLLLGERKGENEKIFRGLKYSACRLPLFSTV